MQDLTPSKDDRRLLFYSLLAETEQEAGEALAKCGQPVNAIEAAPATGHGCLSHWPRFSRMYVVRLVMVQTAGGSLAGCPTGWFSFSQSFGLQVHSGRELLVDTNPSSTRRTLMVANCVPRDLTIARSGISLQSIRQGRPTSLLDVSIWYRSFGLTCLAKNRREDRHGHSTVNVPSCGG